MVLDQNSPKTGKSRHPLCPTFLPRICSGGPLHPLRRPKGEKRSVVNVMQHTFDPENKQPSSWSPSLQRPCCNSRRMSAPSSILLIVHRRAVQHPSASRSVTENVGPCESCHTWAESGLQMLRYRILLGMRWPGAGHCDTQVLKYQLRKRYTERSNEHTRIRIRIRLICAILDAQLFNPTFGGLFGFFVSYSKKG